MTDRRQFLGWDTPALPRAAEWLVEQAGAESTDPSVIDLRTWLVVLPVARAGHRLIELLIEQAETAGAVLLPPRTATPGQLPEVLCPPREPLAGDLVRPLAWSAALRQTPVEELAALFPHRPADDNWQAWWALADLLDRLHRDLAGQRLSFTEVAGQAATWPDPLQQPRWQAAETVYRNYRQQLDRLGLVDPQHARLQAAREEKSQWSGRIVMLAVAAPEARGLLTALLEPLAEQVTPLVFSPNELADAFDEWGFIRPDAWIDRPLKLDDQQIIFANNPSAEADAAMYLIGEHAADHTPEQITIGIGDEKIIPPLQRHFETTHIAARVAAGRPLKQTLPGRLLRCAADHLTIGMFSDLAALMRHPDVERWILANLPSSLREEDLPGQWLTWLDEYYNHTLHGRVTGQWFAARGIGERMKAIGDLLMQWLGDLWTKPRPLGRWARPIAELLERTYADVQLSDASPDHQPTIEALRRLAAGLSDMHELALLPDASDLPTVHAGLAINYLLNRVADQRIDLDPYEPAIELIGWPEALLDDAPVLAMTGLNEGVIPEATNTHPLLPDSARRRLGLVCNDDRLARDKYWLTAIVNSRPTVQLSASRAARDGTPLMPSRLLLSDEDTVMQRRVRAFTTAGTPSPRPDWPIVESARQSVFTTEGDWPPPPPNGPPAQPIMRLSVTAFRAYIACPYRFYLRYVLKLEPIEDRAVELDALAFGELLHAVVEQFGRHDDVRDSERSSQIADFLLTALDRAIAERFGDDLRPSLQIQREQARRRLQAFAEAQAEWAAMGWRIQHVEHYVRNAPLICGGKPVMVDGRPFELSGKIDRIDRNEHTGEWAILDYKSGEQVDDPDKAHRRGRGSAKDWIDLQLPLYRHLAATVGVPDSAQLGYIQLPGRGEQARFAPAPWNDEELDDADATAARIIDRINEGAFYPPADSVRFDEFAMICGEAMLRDIDSSDTNDDAESGDADS